MSDEQSDQKSGDKLDAEIAAYIEYLKTKGRWLQLPQPPRYLKKNPRRRTALSNEWQLPEENVKE